MGNPSKDKAAPEPERRVGAHGGEEGRPGRPPIDLLLHPVSLLALAVMIINDGWLRVAYPNWITGKLSDVAALVFFPAALVAVWGLFLMVVGALWRWLGSKLGKEDPVGPDPSMGTPSLIISLGITGGILVGINTWETFRRGYVGVVEFLDPLGWMGPHGYTADPTDLYTLPALAVPLILGFSQIYEKRERG